MEELEEMIKKIEEEKN